MRPALLALVLGIASGAFFGAWRYQGSEHHDALCVSCHHGTSDPAALEEPKHSTQFDAKCHNCHVIPLKQYLEFTSTLTLGTSPKWVEGVENPVLGGQTCMECHLSRGRGDIECDQCHSEGSANIALSQECTVCHEDQRLLAPFDNQQCRDCHVEVYQDHTSRVQEAMRARFVHGNGEGR